WLRGRRRLRGDLRNVGTLAVVGEDDRLDRGLPADEERLEQLDLAGDELRRPQAQAVEAEPRLPALAPAAHDEAVLVGHGDGDGGGADADLGRVARREPDGSVRSR